MSFRGARWEGCQAPIRRSVGGLGFRSRCSGTCGVVPLFALFGPFLSHKAGETPASTMAPRPNNAKGGSGELVTCFLNAVTSVFSRRINDL